MSAIEEDWRNLEEPSSLPISSQRGKTGARVPPHNIEAEASLLGAMLLSKDAIADALEVTYRSRFRDWRIAGLCAGLRSLSLVCVEYFRF